MELQEEEIEEYRQAWARDFDEELSWDTAQYELERILTFLDSLFEAFYGADRPIDGAGEDCDTMGA